MLASLVDLLVCCHPPQPLQEKFHLSDKVCHAHRHLLSCTGKKRGEGEEEEVRLCDFGQWAAFQAAPGSVRLVPHSQWTKMFLTTCELMDIMQQGSSDAGANYEMEMKTFLNKEDINTPSLPPPSSGGGMEGVLPTPSKRRVRRAAIPSDEEDEDFMPAKKQLSLDSESAVGAAKSAGLLCDAASPMEEMEGSGLHVGQCTPPPGLPSVADGGPALVDCEGSSPSGGGEAGTDVPLPPSFSELDWLDGVTPSQPRSQSVALSGMDSSPRKLTSTPLKANPLTSPQDRRDVHHEADPFQPLASSTVERATPATSIFKVPPAVSKRLSLSPSAQDTVLVSPRLSFLGVEEEKEEEGDGKFEGNASTNSACVPTSAAVENLSATVSCEPSADNAVDETGCEQECEDVNLVGESDLEEDRIHDPSTSILLCNSPTVDQDVGEGAVLTPQPQALATPTSVPTHTGGGERGVSLQEESPLNLQHRKRGRRMRSRRNMLFSQFSPSPGQGKGLACVASGRTPTAHKKKCQIVISDDDSDGDFESPLRKPEKRARAHFGKSDEDSQVEEPTALAVAEREDKEEVMIEDSSDDSAEDWQRCERKLSKKMTKDFVVDEAELSADGIMQYSSDEPDDSDGYDCKDSFINDATLLTQATPKGRQLKKSRRGKPSPNMMGIYRRFLQSPNDDLFGGKGQRAGLRAGGCRMVLSQRHGVLRKYAKKAGFKVPFASPDQAAAPSSAEEISGEHETLGRDVDESSEAEEVQMLHYGEEEGEEVEEEGEEEEEGMVEQETQDPDEQAQEVAECVGEEAFVLGMDVNEVHMPEGTYPLPAEQPSSTLSFARGEGCVEHSVGEDNLFHEVLDDLLAEDIPIEHHDSLCASSPCPLDAGSPGAVREPHSLQPTAMQPRQHPVEQRSSGGMGERGGFPKFQILRPGARSLGEHSEDVLACIDKAPASAVGAGIVVRMGCVGGELVDAVVAVNSYP